MHLPNTLIVCFWSWVINKYYIVSKFSKMHIKQQQKGIYWDLYDNKQQSASYKQDTGSSGASASSYSATGIHIWETA